MENNAAVNAEAVEAEQAVVGEEALPQKKQRKPINQQKLQDNLWGWIFCLPLIVGTLWFVFICLVAAILLSFTNYSIMSGSMFEFLGNFADHIYKTDGVADPWHWYTYAFTNTIKIDPTIPMNEMGVYLFNTVFYMIGIPIGMILAMFFAVCMTRDIPGANVFRVIYYFPCVASTVSIVYTFRLMFNQAGVFNQLFGLDINWINTTGAPALTWNSMTGSASTSAFMVDPVLVSGHPIQVRHHHHVRLEGPRRHHHLYIAGLGRQCGNQRSRADRRRKRLADLLEGHMPDLYPTIFYNIVTAVIGGMQIYAEPEPVQSTGSHACRLCLAHLGDRYERHHRKTFAGCCIRHDPRRHDRHPSRSSSSGWIPRIRD